ncbi:MAG: hypothetical protein M3362_21910, partial [Acidobacteriota bacterium]|nr:hypothetical protein [Acidobacteriota bacterium]
VLLSKEKLDDHGYKTTYTFSYFEKIGEPRFSHKIKILQKGRKNTTLPKAFNRLGPSFCSLGQDLNFYQSLIKLEESLYKAILIALNDITYNKEVAARFQKDIGFEASLIRFSEAEKAYREAPRLLNFGIIWVDPISYSFDFSCKVPGADDSHEVNLDFSPDGTDLHRMIAIIGRNGTGKTQVLAYFANAMSGLDRRHGTFIPQRPSFSKVIAISYSSFDQFKQPEENEIFSYKYCGIRIGDRLLTPIEIQAKLGEALIEVRKADRRRQWKIILKELLNDTFGSVPLAQRSGELNIYAYSRLSAGQRILALIVTEVIAYIEEQSIILFDEPELY